MKEINILIFGDSIVYGAWDRDKGGWVNRLRLTLEKETEVYYNIYNLGIPGETTKELIKRLKNEYIARYNPNMHTIIIFAICINDSQLINGKNNTSKDTFKQNLNKLINLTTEYTNDILFIGLTKVNETEVAPLPWDKTISYLNNEILIYDKLIEDTCKEQKIKYLNVYNLLQTNDLEDGLHPNDNGHQKLCDALIKTLKL